MPDLLLDPPLPAGVSARGATMDDVAAAAEFHGRAFAHVHPEATGRGIGSALAAWTEQHARGARRAQVGQTLPTSAVAARQLLEGRGYEPRWESWVPKMPLDATLAPPRVPAGVTLRELRRPDDDRDVHAVIEEAFDTWPNRDDGMAFEDWRASYLNGASGPGFVVVAEEAGHIVGAAVCIPEGHLGWVDQLAVRPVAWGLGIGGAMLQTAVRGFRDAGLASAALSTDSRTAPWGCTSTSACRSRSPSAGTRCRWHADASPVRTGTPVPRRPTVVQHVQRLEGTPHWPSSGGTQMARHTTAADDTGRFDVPRLDDTGSFPLPDAEPPTPLGRIGELFTQPLAGHVAQYRQPARLALTGVTLLLAVGVVVSPDGADYRSGMTVAGLVAAATMVVASLVPALQSTLNRVSGLLMVGTAHLLVAGTGGAASPLHQLYLLMLVYFAAFYATRRLAATAALAGISLALTEVGPREGSAPPDLVDLATSLVAWVTIVVIVHVLVRRLRDSAHTDPLTGLADHGTFWAAVALEHERARRQHTSYSVLMIDLDHFKTINDTHGHQVGDDILRRVADILRWRTRKVDVPARYGGEEFALVLSATGPVGARTAAEKIRRRIRRLSGRLSVTASIGVATHHPDEDDDPATVVAAADAALYTAKDAGRDRVRVAPSHRQTPSV